MWFGTCRSRQKWTQTNNFFCKMGRYPAKTVTANIKDHYTSFAPMLKRLGVFGIMITRTMARRFLERRLMNRLKKNWNGKVITQAVFLFFFVYKMNVYKVYCNSDTRRYYVLCRCTLIMNSNLTLELRSGFWLVLYVSMHHQTSM